jgi:hypothetical protein
VNLPPHYQKWCGGTFYLAPANCLQADLHYQRRAPDLLPSPGLLEPFADCDVGVAGSDPDSGDIAVPEEPEKLKDQAEEYEKLADAAVDPEEKKRLQGLARAARNVAPTGSDPA